MRQTIKKHRTALIITAACILLTLFLLWQNNGLTVSRHSVVNAKIPEAFDGFRIVHISDLHNKSFGAKQERLLSLVEAQQPDLIVITGDLVDSRHYDLLPAMALIEGAVQLAPVYYVSGNHEINSGHWAEVKEAVREAGAEMMDDRFVSITREGSSIQLLGLGEARTSFLFDDGTDEQQTTLSRMAVVTNAQLFRLLLTHRPERFSAYCASGVELVLCGHAHGGQIRLPGIGGLYAPNQGFSPKYDSGAYTQDGTTMLVSRGLGNSLFPFRIWNRPEVLTITLYHGEAETA